MYVCMYPQSTNDKVAVTYPPTHPLLPHPCVWLDRARATNFTHFLVSYCHSSASLSQQFSASQPRRYSLTGSLPVSEFIGLAPLSVISLKDQACSAFVYINTKFRETSRKWKWTHVLLEVKWQCMVESGCRNVSVPCVWWLLSVAERERKRVLGLYTKKVVMRQKRRGF